MDAGTLQLCTARIASVETHDSRWLHLSLGGSLCWSWRLPHKSAYNYSAVKEHLMYFSQQCTINPHQKKILFRERRLDSGYGRFIPSTLLMFLPMRHLVRSAEQPHLTQWPGPIEIQRIISSHVPQKEPFSMHWHCCHLEDCAVRSVERPPERTGQWMRGVVRCGK